MMHPLRLLWILPYLPWPTTSGGKLRQYHLLRQLALRGHRISLLVQTKTRPRPEDLAALRPWLEQLWVLPRRPLRSATTLAAAVLSPAPLLASINGYSHQLTRQLEHILIEPWDLVQIEHSYSLQPYQAVLKRRQQGFILTEHNVESQLSASTYRRLPALLQPLAHLDRWRYRRWEQAAMAQARAVIALTEPDAKVFRSLTRRPVHVVPNGADLQAGAAVRADHAAQRMLFIGNYEYSPNVAAVEWLLCAIMPLVWAQLPATRVAIGGFAMPDDWATRWPDPRIEWHGYVADLATLQSVSSLFLTPLLDGGGSKLKVLEALAAGLPLVSTAQGVSGLELSEGKQYLAGSDSFGLATAALQLLQSATLATAIGEAGRAAIQRFGWGEVSHRLEQAYQQVLACA